MAELESGISGGQQGVIRVLITGPLMSRPGGVAQYLKAIRPHLRNDVQYFTIGSRSDHERIDTSIFRTFQDSWGFATTLRHGHYDVVHLNPSIGAKAFFRDGLLLIIAKVFRKAVVVFAHGWDEAFEHLLSGRLCRLFHLMYGRADAFIVLGQEFKRRLRRLGYERQVFVQGAPIDDELLADCLREPVRKGADRSKFNLLFLARLEREKGIYEALDTFRLLKREFPYITMTVAGDGSERARAAAYAQSASLEDVTFVGYVEGNAKYEVYRGADAYLFPSYTEGLPISVLEAMAYGLPIVTCAVGGLPDFFRHGTMGFVTEEPNPKILATLVSRLIEDPALASRISHFNRNYAREQFNGPHVAADLEGVYRFLLEGADRTRLPAR